MQVIKPNSEDQTAEHPISIFLAGSIEMGLAENWQETLEKSLTDEVVTVYNPRRDDWDSSWKQEQRDPQFNNQVNWELNSLESADLIFMYFSPGTKSPISLLELGKFSYRGSSVIVCCPDEFWRKGNVEILCTRDGVQLFDNLEDAIGALHTKIKQLKR